MDSEPRQRPCGRPWEVSLANDSPCSFVMMTRLIINLPPRYLKSLTVSVAFSAFLLGLDPTRRVTCLSYGGDLAAKHASDFRSIVNVLPK